MSNKREPLLSDEFLGTLAADPEWPDGPKWYPSATQVRNTYEAARAKDAELIQQLVDALHKCTVARPSVDGQFVFATIDAAEAAGFKPSDR